MSIMAGKRCNDIPPVARAVFPLPGFRKKINRDVDGVYGVSLDGGLKQNRDQKLHFQMAGDQRRSVVV